jgi:hypothetical protein
MTPAGTRLQAWKTDGAKAQTDLVWAIETLKGWNPVVLNDGSLVDGETGKRLHRNHLRSMLRREYLEAGKPLSGRALHVMLDACIDAIIAINRKIIRERRGSAQESMFHVHDDYV